MYNQEIIWYFTKDELPKTENDNSVCCVCEKRYEFKQGEGVHVRYRTKVLTYNPYYNCWDDADGDDFNCKLDQVRRWTYLPYPPPLPKEDK